jgi:hypothetical protein
MLILSHQFLFTRLIQHAVSQYRHLVAQSVGHWKEQERKLQAKGTKSARRHRRTLSGKLLRQGNDHAHVLSTHLVQAVIPGRTIVLKNLSATRERVTHKRGEGQRRMHGWSCTHLWGFTSDKAEARGIQ